jgi:hypothetical protein
MRKAFYAKERLEFTDRGAVTEQQPNLSSRLELKQKHRDTGEGKTRKGVNDLQGISGIRDVVKQRGKNHQRNGGGWMLKHESTLFGLAALFLAGQEFPLGLGYLCREAFEKLSFLDPSLHLLTKFDRDI